MTKVKKIVIGALVSIVTLGGLITFASPGSQCSMHEKGADFVVNRISSKLDLNDVQKQNLVVLKDTIQEQKVLHKTDNPREELMQLLSEPVLDEARVLEMLEQRTANLKSAAPMVVTALANFTNSLSDEQRAEIQDVADRIANHRGGPFGRHHGPFGGSDGSL